jgi:hypothetical protein
MGKNLSFQREELDDSSVMHKNIPIHPHVESQALKMSITRLLRSIQNHKRSRTHLKSELRVTWGQECTRG